MKNKIKVAQFVGSMNCGGTENMLMNVFRNIDKNKYEFTFILNVKDKCWFEEEILSLGGKILRIKKIDNIFNYIRYLKNIFKENKFDVVHSHVFLHSGLVMLAAKKSGVKIRISHSHSAMSKKENNFFKRNILKWILNMYSTKKISCSTEAGVSLFGESFKKYGIVIRNPLDENKIINIINNNNLNLKKVYNINNNNLIIAHIGRLTAVKNHDFLINIAKELVNKKINFKMFFIGEGELRQKIENKIINNKLENYIIMTGNVSNIYNYIENIDIIVLPSIYEGLPLTLIEAQAFNKHCLVSNNVSKESDMKTDLLRFLDIDNGVDKWINEIIKLSDDINKFSNMNIQKIKDSEFSLSNVIRKLDKIYIGGKDDKK